jgi:hypothetical protein
LLSGVPALWNAKPIPLGLAESKKETNSLRLSGDYKLSNYNTIPYCGYVYLVPICPNHIMLAYHLCNRQIKMTERHAAQAPALRERFHKSSPKNRDLRSAPSIINSQSGSGFAGLGFRLAISPAYGNSAGVPPVCQNKTVSS